MRTIHLDPNMVPETLKYHGKKYQVSVQEKYTIRAETGIWSGGSRTTARLVEIATGESFQLSDNTSAPWDDSRKNKCIDIKPGFVVVEHSYFGGKDMGNRFYARSADIAPMLPKPESDLTRAQLIVLFATKSYKASYNGQDRFDMGSGDFRYTPTADMISREQWHIAKAELIERKLLNKAGAITVNGKNAAPERISDID